MAVDTAAKRLSMMDMCRVMEPAIPFPDGTIDASDRLAFLWLYSGIAAGEAEETVIQQTKLSIGINGMSI